MKPPADRRLFDMFNACPWNTRDLRIDHVTEILIGRGMSRDDAEKTASAAYARWDAQTKVMGAG